MAVERAITVTQFNGFIKQIFDAEELLRNIRIIGEVSDISFHRGIAYFSLKDECATLPCISFNGDLGGILKEGLNCIVTGSPNYYVKGGKLNFNVAKLEPAGEGDLFKRFLLLKEALEKEGLFDASHKKTLPKDIRRIGVITSREGAVIEDIISITQRRNPGIDIVIFPVKVQGLCAETEIAHAIDCFSKYTNIDVIIVARGGGSLEDLMAYNTEIVARAAYSCQKPLISAVGHETDFTILDLVADLRAPTPSAAAELTTVDISGKKREIKGLVREFGYRLANFMVELKEVVFGHIEGLAAGLEKELLKERRSLEKKGEKLISLTGTVVNERIYELSILDAKLKKLDPFEILKMGYAKVSQTGRPIGGVREITPATELEITFKDGTVMAMPKQSETNKKV